MIEPMLCRSPKPGELDELLQDGNAWYMDRKYDGGRYLCIFGPNGQQFLSRRLSKVTGKQVDKAEKVPHLSSLIFPREFHGIILDGELVGPKTETSSEIFKDENVGRQRYEVFDYIDLQQLDTPYVIRQQRLTVLLDKLKRWVGAPHWYLYVTQTTPYIQSKRETLDSWLSLGLEGAVFKHASSPYQLGKRGWVKYKAVETFDCVVMGFDLPNKWYARPGERGADGVYYSSGKYTRFHTLGWIGALQLGQYVDGVLTPIGTCSGMDDKTREWFTNNPYSIGSVVEVKAQERSKKEGSYHLRHPRYVALREDKNPEECVV